MARVLIVDRGVQIRKLLSVILTRAGHEIHTAHNPQTAIEMCNPPESFDLVLSGVAMPVMDGHDLARWIASHCPNTRVILMSAVDSGCEACPYAGGCRVIPKPFAPKEVVALIAEALARPSS